jgi:hypothetical protein
MGLGLGLNNSRTVLSHNIPTSSITTHTTNTGRSGGWNVRLQRTPLTKTLFFPMFSAGGFEFGLRWRSVGLFHGMAWRLGTNGRNWGALPISFGRNHHNIFVCLYNFTIPPCKRKKRYIQRLRINIWETSGARDWKEREGDGQRICCIRPVGDK